MINDKFDKLQNINIHKPVLIELGCGQKKKIPGAIGIDIIDYPDVDIVGDVYDVLKSLPKNSIDEIYAFHFFEHVSDVSLLLAEIARILKTKGRVQIVVPHFSNPFFYSDPTHRSFFGLYTFGYFAKCSNFWRTLPTYALNDSFQLESVRLIFKSYRPFYLRHGIKKVFETLVNISEYTKELYEENFCYIAPCYEVDYRIVRL